MKGTEFAKLWDVFKLLMTISHGQASVERGYSVDEDMLIECLQEKTVVALRTVCDGISATKQDFTELPFNPRLKRNVKAARMRYSQQLEDQKKEEAGREKKTRKERHSRRN